MGTSVIMVKVIKLRMMLFIGVSVSASELDQLLEDNKLRNEIDLKKFPVDNQDSPKDQKALFRKIQIPDDSVATNLRGRSHLCLSEARWQIKLKLPDMFQKPSKKFKIPRFIQAPNTWAAISTLHCSTFLFIVNSWVLGFSFSCHFLDAWTSTPTFQAE